MSDVTEKAPEVHIVEMTSSEQPALADCLRDALRQALADKGEMDPAIYDVKGFCGRKFRLLLNNLVRQMNGEARYLEVGVFKGATLCPVINNNVVRAMAIDNWSWDKDNTCASTFYTNLSKFKTSKCSVSVIEEQFRNIPIAKLGPFNIYFYDGDHGEKDQYDGVAWAIDGLDDQAIVLVDDWNWPQVRRGTMNALNDAKVNLDYVVELRTTIDNTFPKHAYQTSDWHNGFFGAVISKPK